MRISYWLSFLCIGLFMSLLVGCISLDLKTKDVYEEKFITGDEKSGDKILLLPIQGIITSAIDDSRFGPGTCIAERIQEQLRLAAKDKKIKAIILEIDSPGGGVTASDIIYQSIKSFKQSHPDIPIIALMKDTAASGAYYIAMATDHVMAHPTTITGSIGVISVFIILEDLLGKIGVQTVVIKSGQAKDVGSPFRKMTDEEKEYLQKIIDEMYQRFLGIVVEGRKDVLDRDKIKALADGRIMTGQEAHAQKLVDEIGYLDDAIKKVKGLANLTQARVIRYKLFRGVLESAFHLETPGSGLYWLSKTILLRSGTPQFMYLWMPSLDRR